MDLQNFTIISCKKTYFSTLFYTLFSWNTVFPINLFLSQTKGAGNEVACVLYFLLCLASEFTLFLFQYINNLLKKIATCCRIMTHQHNSVSYRACKPEEILFFVSNYWSVRMFKAVYLVNIFFSMLLYILG